jgi:ribonucleoside-diphosphate reductase alpha chain
MSHPEIEEFLEIRKTSGDFNRKALNLHHGVLLTDDFMQAVRDGADFNLKSPKDGSVRGKVNARSCSRSWSRCVSPRASPIWCSATR